MEIFFGEGNQGSGRPGGFTISRSAAALSWDHRPDGLCLANPLALSQMARIPNPSNRYSAPVSPLLEVRTALALGGVGLRVMVRVV